MPKTSGTTPRVKRTGRKRQIAACLALTLGLLLTTVWCASRWWTLGYASGGWAVRFSQGVCIVNTDSRALLLSSHWDFTPIQPPFQTWLWLTDGNTPTTSSTSASTIDLRLLAHEKYTIAGPGGFILEAWWIALWPLALAALLGGGWLVWSGRQAKRRAMTNVCPKCGYDLSGLAAGSLCPECGKQPVAA